MFASACFDLDQSINCNCRCCWFSLEICIWQMLDVDILEKYCFFCGRTEMTSEVKIIYFLGTFVSFAFLTFRVDCDHRFHSKYCSSWWILSFLQFFLNILWTSCSFFCWGMSHATIYCTLKWTVLATIELKVNMSNKKVFLQDKLLCQAKPLTKYANWCTVY